MTKPEHDLVNHPPHYNVNGVPECIDIIEGLGFGYHLGNCFKYLYRAGRKDDAKTIEDLKKARWFLDRYITTLENKK